MAVIVGCVTVWDPYGLGHESVAPPRPAPRESVHHVDVTTYLAIEEHVANLTEERARGDAFERVIAHFLRRDPVLGMRRVWTWRDWPGRPAAGVGPLDLGIDMVAEDDQGELVGVQVKHRLDPRSHLRWGDVATALGFRPDLFARRLIVTNAADRTANARKATSTTPNTGWVLRADLIFSPIDWTGALEAGTGTAAPDHLAREPRPYQRTAVADVLASLAGHDRTQLVMACGSGKTLVTLWIGEARADERILVLVPTLLLLKQFRREWREAATLPFVDLAVCSDADTVGADEWQVRADELGVPVTTDPATIAAFLRGPGRRVIFGTYASSARVAEAQEDVDVPAFDLVVADEAHRISGVVNTGVHKDRDLRVVLDAERIRASRRLFATATPRIYGAATRRRADELEDVEVASMDDETLFGPVAHRLWFRAAVDLGVLTDYQLIAVLVTDAEVADLVRERAGVIIDGKVLDAETLATLVAVRRTIDDLGLTRAITFHHTIARARGFAHGLRQIELATSAPDAEHISGAMSVDERERVLQVLKEPARPTVVTNARCLTEGIDVPSLDAVAFVDPRSSQVDIVQAVGRVMRRAPGKDRGYVVVPVFLRAADLANPESAIESTAFGKVLDVLRALRAHDPDLASDASRIKASLGPHDAVAGGHIAAHLRLLGVGVDPARFERALELRFVDVAAEPFEVGLAVLRRYAEREGHSRVPALHREGGFGLGGTVRRWRALFRLGVLPPRLVDELEALPGWSWDPFTDDESAALASLRAFVAREGHARVPALHRDGGLGLGHSVRHWRNEYKAGRLDPDLVASLEELPGWAWEVRRMTTRRGEWDLPMQALWAFALRNGHTRVPATHREGEIALGGWVRGRRQAFASGSLRPEKIAELEALPQWSWRPHDDAWDSGYAALRAFVEREGHPRVPTGHRESGVQLSAWCQHQRIKYDRGLLLLEQASELLKLPGWSFDPHSSKWQAALAALHNFVAREGHAVVPASHLEGTLALGGWVSRRRGEYNAGRLDPSRVAELQALPGWTWNSRERPSIAK